MSRVRNFGRGCESGFLSILLKKNFVSQNSWTCLQDCCSTDRCQKSPLDGLAPVDNCPSTIKDGGQKQLCEQCTLEFRNICFLNKLVNTILSSSCVSPCVMKLFIPKRFRLADSFWAFCHCLSDSQSRCISFRLLLPGHW